ncbi:GNAT family N-acetyltransferase [Yinghuangia soli]|uniref:GNAT family N-acetyltransferase n=1 Tax=Yinghuangia soli TaxID=2908204 RepID=A0AA41PWN3_9ACTN|nr:GNAT family N-acetyltransferase [Yinghuangia soli]MCF2527096.1 GNAT family N-acetyltransferase [Yinghuangia soli]
MVQFDENPDRERRLWLGRRLEADNTAASPVLARMKGQPAADEFPVHVYAIGDGGEVVGGVAGKTWAYWLHVDLLWVDKEHRGAGLGGQLLARAEEIARTEHGCTHVRLETWDFQAPEFYRKKGYAVVGEVHDYPPGVTEYILAKKLG